MCCSAICSVHTVFLPQKLTDVTCCVEWEKSEWAQKYIYRLINLVERIHNLIKNVGCFSLFNLRLQVPNKKQMEYMYNYLADRLWEYVGCSIDTTLLTSIKTYLLQNYAHESFVCVVLFLFKTNVGLMLILELVLELEKVKLGEFFKIAEKFYHSMHLYCRENVKMFALCYIRRFCNDNTKRSGPLWCADLNCFSRLTNCPRRSL